MAKKTAQAPTQETVQIGPLELTREWLLAQPAESFGKSGVYVTNEREKVTIIADDGRPVKFAITFSVQRDALNDDEQSECDKAATSIEARKSEKLEKETKERERSVKAAFDLGQSSTMTAIKNIGDLAQGARALSQLNR